MKAPCVLMCVSHRKKEKKEKPRQSFRAPWRVLFIVNAQQSGAGPSLPFLARDFLFRLTKPKGFFQRTSSQLSLDLHNEY